jgi:phosphate uptake regulator
MERRKLQATGGSSLTITLPKSWTKQWKLKSKDEVTVNNAGYALIIKPISKAKREVSIKISIDDMPNDWLLREMIGAYIGGADKITLSSDRITPSQNQTIRQAVQLLFGFEILEETSTKIVARTVLDDTMFPVSDSTIRTFMISRGMFEDALKAAKAGDKDLADDIKLRDYEVNKLVHVVKRQFNEIVSGKIEGNLREVGYYRSVAGQLERIGDHAVKIAELASAERTETVKLSSTFPVIQGKLNHLLSDVEAMIKNLDKNLANKIIDRGTELEQLIYSSRRMKQSYEGAIIEDSLDRLRSYLINIAEMTIDYKLSSMSSSARAD